MHRRVTSRRAAPTAQQTSTLSGHLFFLQNVPFVSSRQQKSGFIKSVRPQSSRNAASSTKHRRPTLLQSDLGHLDCWWFVFLQYRITHACTVRQHCINTQERQNSTGAWQQIMRQTPVCTNHLSFLQQRVSCSCAQ